MPRVRRRGDFPALSEPFHVYTDLEPLEVKAVPSSHALAFLATTS